MKRVFFVELNEFNLDVLKNGANRLGLKNLQRLVSLHQSSTWTEDVYESDFLEPWVQWVSVHTGVPSSIHKIKHLGDVPHLDTPQVWERLSEQGISTGIWGAMNASRGKAKTCRFFVPDPWTASENAYPPELNALLDPVRYLSKNYLNRSWKVLLQKIGDLIRLLFQRGLGKVLFYELAKLPMQLMRHGSHHFLFICLADYLNTRLFLEYRKETSPDFSLLFLNSIAHLQHHYWEGGPIDFGLKNMDRIFGHLFEALGKDEIFVVANALSQKNTREETPWILYRQIDPMGFLKAVGIFPRSVEPHMTHDAHLFFASANETKQAEEWLKKATIEQKPLFHTESYAQDPLKLFYKIIFTDKVSSDARFELGGKTYRFFDLFQAIVERTGRHVQEAAVFCNQPLFPARLMNHELLDLLPTLLFGSVSTAFPPFSAEPADRMV